MLSCSHALSTRLLQGKLGKRSGNLLITYSSFLRFDLWEKKQRISQGIVLSKELKGVVGPEMSRAWGWLFKVHDKTRGLLQRALSCQKPLTNPHLSEHHSTSVIKGDDPSSVTSC